MARLSAEILVGYRPSQVIISFLEGANGGWAFRRATAILVSVAYWRRNHESLRIWLCSLGADEHNITQSRFYIIQHPTRAQMIESDKSLPPQIEEYQRVSQLAVSHCIPERDWNARQQGG